MQKIDQGISDFARRHSLRRGIESAAVLKAVKIVLPKCLPETLYGEVEALSFNAGTLTLAAPSGAPLATLSLHRPTIQSALREYFGKDVVEKIVTRAVNSQQLE